MGTIKNKYLDKISNDFQLLSEIVLTQISYIRMMVKEGHSDLSEELEKNEILIDGLDLKMREEVINAIFLFSPKAIDLRKIIAYHNMTIYLERIGDLILNISHFLHKNKLNIKKYAELEMPLSKMLKYAEEMLKNAVFAFTCEDNSMAYQAISADDKVDELYHTLTKNIHVYFSGKTLDVSDLVYITSMNSILYNVERIADNATNIAEAAIYLVEGKDIRHGNNNDKG